MTGLSLGPPAPSPGSFRGPTTGRFVDVGTAQGALAATLAMAHPHLTGIGFDLPAVRPHLRGFVADHGLSTGCRFQAGDFFADPLPAADVIVMGHVLHDWGLEKKQMLIGKAYEALPAGGSLIVYEAIIDDDRRQNAFGLLMSLNMLIETREASTTRRPTASAG